MADILKPRGTKNSWTWAIIEKDVHLVDDVAAGLTNHVVYSMAAGAHTIDEHVDEVMVHVENPPGGGKTITVTVSNGISTMTVTITGDTDVFGMTTTNNFDWDVSAQALTVLFSTSAGTSTGKMAVHIAKHEITI